jgi:hypothetical protein
MAWNEWFSRLAEKSWAEVLRVVTCAVDAESPKI